MQKDVSTAPESASKKVVLSFLAAINNHDFNGARNLVQDGLTFVGVMGSRLGADVYFDDMERMRLKYDVKKVFVDADDVAVFYDITMNGKTIFCCGWYQLSDNRIKSIRVVFDPRPLLEKSN